MTIPNPFDLNAPRHPGDRGGLDVMLLREARRSLARLHVWTPTVSSRPPEYVAEVLFRLEDPYAPTNYRNNNTKTADFGFGWDDGIIELEQLVVVHHHRFATESITTPAEYREIGVNDHLKFESLRQELTPISGLRAEIIWQRLDAELGRLLRNLRTLETPPWRKEF